MKESRILKGLRFIFTLNYIKTVYLNFKLLPFSQAIHFPILLFGRIKLAISKSASIEFTSNVRTGMLRFGYIACPIVNVQGRSDLVLRGRLILGDHIIVNPRSIIQVQEYGILEIGDWCYFGSNAKVVAQHHIVIGSNTRISWECQIFDTDFHYLLNKGTSEVKNNKGQVIIGKSCWIGNRVSINKNTKLPGYSTVASNSLLNKDYGAEERLIVGGIPAKVICKGFTRVMDYKMELRLNEYFAQSNENTYKFNR